MQTLRVTRCAAVVALLVLIFSGAPGRLGAQTESGIEWQEGPGVARIGDLAELRLPDGYRFAGKAGAKRFLELTQNPPSGKELGVVIPRTGPNESPWFVIFEFDEIGYVKDDEKNQLDGDAILSSIQKGNERANEERRKRGWTTMDIVGWHQAPRYDAVTNNLTWSILGRSEGSGVVNHSVRILGRRGVMDADLVLEPTQAGAVQDFDKLLTGFTFVQGSRYAEFTSGDKIAQYGLTALVAGGVGAAAMKSGLLGKIWKFLVFGALALVALLKRVFGGLFGRRSPEPQPGASAPSR